MFKLNLKIAWRNLWKNKVYTAINIGGLAIGLTARKAAVNNPVDALKYE